MFTLLKKLLTTDLRNWGMPPRFLRREFLPCGLSLGVFFCSSLVPSYADYIAPDLVKVSTDSYRSVPLIFNRGRYTYAVKWNGIPVANAEIILGEPPQLGRQDISLTPAVSVIRVSVKTTKGIDLLYRLRHTSESVFNRAALQPIGFTSDQTENSKYKRWEVSFSANKEISSRLFKKPERVSPDEERIFTSENFTLDPLFGALLARSVPVKLGEELSFDVWNGKHRYLIKFQVEDRELVQIGKAKVLADKVIPTVQKLTDSEGEKRLKSATMWVSADDRREILKVESKIFLGSVTAVLTGVQEFEPAAQKPQVIQAEKVPAGTPVGRAMLDAPRD